MKNIITLPRSSESRKFPNPHLGSSSHFYSSKTVATSIPILVPCHDTSTDIWLINHRFLFQFLTLFQRPILLHLLLLLFNTPHSLLPSTTRHLIFPNFWTTDILCIFHGCFFPLIWIGRNTGKKWYR